MNTLTATENKFMEVLNDGQHHSMAELLRLLPDTMGEGINVRYHIHNIRKKISGSGLRIICDRMDSVTYYRLARALPSANDGRK